MLFPMRSDISPERNAYAASERIAPACRSALINCHQSRCREAVILRKIEGLSRREIAARMGITEQTVNQAFERTAFVCIGRNVFGDHPI